MSPSAIATHRDEHERVNIPRTTDEVLQRSRIVVPINQLLDLGGADGLDRVEVVRKRLIIMRRVAPQLREGSLLKVLLEDVIGDIEYFLAVSGPDLEVRRRRVMVAGVAQVMAVAVTARKGRPPQLRG